MRLPRPFFQLPVIIDANRLEAEVAALPAEAWGAHPDRLTGNTAVQLISPGGVETETLHGEMLPTRWLAGMPYVRQILSSFGVVWSRSRLMRLAPGASVPDHADINHHWHTRVRVHIPVVTWPEVRFHCGGEVVHMAEGEAWIFDNWRRHRVENGAPHERIHLVADTTGTSAFWRFACGAKPPRERWPTLAWQPGRDVQPMTESNQPSPVMPAAELQMLVGDLCGELVPSSGNGERVGAFAMLMEGFVQDWRQLCGLHGTAGRGEAEFRKLASSVHGAAKTLSEGLMMRTNGVSALHVLEARVLKHVVMGEPAPQVAVGPAQVAVGPARVAVGSAQAAACKGNAPGVNGRGQAGGLLEKPVFIVAAPRSGSTLLFDTLACSTGFNTFGGEAHWLIEGVEALRPGAPGIDSNRLTAKQATAQISGRIREAAVARLQGTGGGAPVLGARMLEKTPKNSLRISFLEQVFPDARFIFLWREPRENLSSIMEAWRSGSWVTYPAVPGWDGPWSLLLPPGWQQLRGAPLEKVAAWQWLQANEIALEDLQQLPREDWTAVGFHELVADPAGTVRRVCEFVGVAFDEALQRRTASALPQSRSTHTPPAADKWRRNEAAIERVLPDVESCWQRLRELR